MACLRDTCSCSSGKWQSRALPITIDDWAASTRVEHLPVSDANISTSMFIDPAQ
jgi:hypothetical protein